VTVIALNLKTAAGTQFTNFNFTDFVKLNGKYYGFNSDGIFTLDTAETDDGTDIDAYFGLVTSNFGISNLKRIRSGFVHYEGGRLKATVRFDDNAEFSSFVSPLHTGQAVGKFKGRRDYKGGFIQLKIENVDGSDFSVDQIDVIPFILRLKPSGFVV